MIFEYRAVKKLFSLIVFCLVLSAFIPLQAQGKEARIAFLEFRVNSQKFEKDLGVSASERLQNVVLQNSRVFVVERTQFQALAKEHELQYSALVDENTAIEIGKIAGADYVVLGSVNAMGDVVFISARLVDVQQGLVLNSFEVTSKNGLGGLYYALGDMGERIAQTLSKRGIAKLNEKAVPPTPTPKPTPRIPQPVPTRTPVIKPPTATPISINPEESFSSGLEAFEKKNFSQAVKHWRRASDAGHIEATARLGECYYHGWGVSKNTGKAFSLLKNAAARNSSYARAILYGIDPNKFAQYRSEYLSSNRENPSGEKAQAITPTPKPIQQAPLLLQNPEKTAANPKTSIIDQHISELSSGFDVNDSANSKVEEQNKKAEVASICEEISALLAKGELEKAEGLYRSLKSDPRNETFVTQDFKERFASGCAFLRAGRDKISVSEHVWPFVPVLLHTFKHSKNVLGVAFSPDSHKVLTGSFDKTAKLWNVFTGKILHTFEHSQPVLAVAFSPDGRKVLTGSFDKTAKLWDASTGELLQTFKYRSYVLYYVSSVAFSPDGRKILTGSGEENTAKLWDLDTGEILHTFEYPGDLWAVAFSPDGRKILAGGKDNTAKLWDVSTGEILHAFEHSEDVRTVAFSPDGRRVLTGSQDNTAKLWDASMGRVLHVFEHLEDVWAVAFSPDGCNVLTGSWDNSAKLWDVSTGECLYTFKCPKDVQAVAFSPDGRKIVIASRDGTAKLWQIVP